MQNKIINIEDVNLKTMQVEIKALTVNGKQMTLSVFRQIPHASIFDDEIEIKGTPWGTVNYFWKDNEAWLHLIWQKNDRLFRDLIPEPPYVGFYSYEMDKYLDSIPVSGIYTRESREYLIRKYKAACDRFLALPQLFIAM